MVALASLAVIHVMQLAWGSHMLTHCGCTLSPAAQLGGTSLPTMAQLAQA